MCHERWMWRRRQTQADESREMWAEFDRVTPLAEPDLPEEGPEPAPAEAREEVSAPDR